MTAINSEGIAPVVAIAATLSPAGVRYTESNRPGYIHQIRINAALDGVSITIENEKSIQSTYIDTQWTTAW